MSFTFTNYAGMQPQEDPFSMALKQAIAAYQLPLQLQNQYAQSQVEKEKGRYAGPMASNALQKAILDNQILGVQSKYAEPMAGQELQKSKLFNQFYGPEAQARINLQNAQGGYYGAEAAKAQSEAAKLQFIQDLLNKNIGGRGNVGGQQQGTPGNLPEYLRGSQPQGNLPRLPLGGINANNLARNASQIPSVNNLPERTEDIQNRGLDYPTAALLAQYTGVPSKIENVAGTYMGLTPFGSYPIQEGLSPEQEARQKELGKVAGESYKNTIESYSGLQNQGVALDEMINTVNTNPEFQNVTGPISSVITKWMGTPAGKETLGRLGSTSGEIALQVAPALKGAFTGRDQTLISSIKANPTDFPEVFVGKLKAQKLVNEVLMKRAELAADYIEKGMSPIKAYKKSASDVPLEQYRNQVNALIHPVSQKMNSTSAMGANRPYAQLSTEQLIKLRDMVKQQQGQGF